MCAGGRKELIALSCHVPAQHPQHTCSGARARRIQRLVRSCAGSLRSSVWAAVGALSCSLVLIGSPLNSVAQTTFSVLPPASQIRRDGSGDFEFETGLWHTHLMRLVRPLSGSSAWVEYEGTTRVERVWSGRGNLLELDVTGPAGRIEALSLRLYNPGAREWSINFASRSSGSVSRPPAIGTFTGGRGEFFDQETFNGRSILLRFSISSITPTSCHFEQAFSDDGGKNWEVNWIADDTRMPGTANEPS